MNLSKQIFKIDGKSPFLDQVRRLADANSKFLGFFPADAFRESADGGRLLIHVDNAGKQLLGYLLYSISRRRAVIQQCCIAPDSRRQGVGYELIEELKRLTQHVDKIVLHCAREFIAAHKFWCKMGFAPEDEKLGRGKNQRPLTKFVFDHNAKHLWSDAEHYIAATTICAVIDTNIFIDVFVSPDKGSPESLVLSADWLTEFSTLYVTDELFAEIERKEDTTTRTKSKLIARQMPRLRCSAARLATARKMVETVLSGSSKTSALADARFRL